MIANHESFLDPLAVGLAVRRRIHYLARRTLFTHPTFGNFLRSVGCVPVDQEGFAREGARLTVLARNPERLSQLGGHLLELGADDVLAVPGDVAVPEDLAAAVQGSAERFSSLDVVVCNAGGPPAGRPA